MSAQELTNAFVRDYAKSKQLDVGAFDEEKEWGGYYILGDGPNYDIKILRVKPRQILSLQSHGDQASPGHHEIWTPLTNARMIREKTVDTLEIIDRTQGGIVTIAGGLLHTLVNPFAEDDVYVYEVRVSSATETSDEREKLIKRVYDMYGRAPEYPPDLLKAILDTPFDPKVANVPVHNV